jgi:hypothetical protein
VGITAGPDGALWFTALTTIGRITTAGVVTQYPVRGAEFLYGITAGPDGALWFTDSFANRIGRITTGGEITQFPLPTGFGQEYGEPTGITTGPDGALWFAQVQWTNIGRITTAGEFSWYPTTENEYSAPLSIVTGPDGELWLGANGGGAIAEAVFVTADLSVTPSGGNFGSALAFTGSGFAPGENVRIYVAGVGSAVMAGATADSSGSFTATARSPQSANGPRLFLGVGQSSGKLGAAKFTMGPHMAIDPDSGTPGSRVLVEGSGYGPLDAVDIYWNGTSLGSAAADIHGTFDGKATFTFTVPEGKSPGSYTVSATGSRTGADVWVYFDVK